MNANCTPKSFDGYAAGRKYGNLKCRTCNVVKTPEHFEPRVGMTGRPHYSRTCLICLAARVGKPHGGGVKERVIADYLSGMEIKKAAYKNFVPNPTAYAWLKEAGVIRNTRTRRRPDEIRHVVNGVECAACMDCEKILPLLEFPVFRGKPLVTRCRPCRIARTKKYHDAYYAIPSRKEQKLQASRIRQRKMIRSRETLCRVMIGKFRCSSRRKGIPFDLNAEDILAVFPANEICPALGVPFEYGSHLKAPSLDRVVPSLGYVKGNVAVISCRANTIKQDATAAEIRAVADWLDKVTSKP